MVARLAVKRKRSFIFVIAISCTKGRTPFAPVNVAALAIRLLIQSKDGRHVWNESLVFGQTSWSCQKSDPSAGILSRNE
jgi:hypothetical protein